MLPIPDSYMYSCTIKCFNYPDGVKSVIMNYDYCLSTYLKIMHTEAISLKLIALMNLIMNRV